MNLLSLKRTIASHLESKLGLAMNYWEIERSNYADLTTKLAFKMEGNKQKNAERIANALQGLDPIQRIETVGPYVNLHLDRPSFASGLLDEIEIAGDKFGGQPKKGKKVILEHTSINPTGPIHIGRFRNPVIGDALRRILTFAGYDVETHYYVNDVGRQIVLITLAMERGINPDLNLVKKWEDYKGKNDFDVFFRYVPAYAESERNPEFAREVSEFIRDAEEGKRNALEKLRKTARYALEGQLESLTRCGFHYDAFDFESEMLESNEVKEITEKLKSLAEKEGKLKILPNGAVGIDLGLGREATIIQRADGTSVYIARDIVYHLRKMKLGDICINVLGEDHKLEFQELKALLEMLGENTEKLDVVHFSFIDLAGKRMSTRRGEIIPLDTVLDEGVGKALEIIKEKNPGLGNRERVAEAVGIGAIKYFLVKTDPMKKITFRWEEALDFEGDTGPYIQYARVRAESILRKASEGEGGEARDNKANPSGIPSDIPTDVNDHEWELIMKLAEFPEVVEEAVNARAPNLVANYTYSLASTFNAFYHKEKVIGSENEDFRLRLVGAVSQVLGNGMYLLGLEPLGEM